MSEPFVVSGEPENFTPSPSHTIPASSAEVAQAEALRITPASVVHSGTWGLPYLIGGRLQSRASVKVKG